MPNRIAPRTIQEYIFWAEQQIEDAGLCFGHGTDSALDEATWITAGALGLTTDVLEQQYKRELTEPEKAKLRHLVSARVTTRKPTAYLLHEAWFAGLRFYVDERVIVPRSHIAEFIREQFQPWIKRGHTTRVQRILDLCTGSGCMAIAAAYAFPGAQVDASDVSPAALEVTRINVKNHELTERVRLVQSDLFEKLAGERYDLIITNPPYVDNAVMQALPEEYRHEPAQALAGGTHGLETIRRILAEAGEHLHPAGLLVMETGDSGVTLQEQHPRVPFLWLTTSTGDESVFLLTAEQLAEHYRIFINNSIVGGS